MDIISENALWWGLGAKQSQIILIYNGPRTASLSTAKSWWDNWVIEDVDSAEMSVRCYARVLDIYDLPDDAMPRATVWHSVYNCLKHSVL